MYVELSNTTDKLIVKVLSTIMPVMVLVTMMLSLTFILSSKISPPDLIHLILGAGLPSAVQLKKTDLGITTEIESSESLIKMGMSIKGIIYYSRIDITLVTYR